MVLGRVERPLCVFNLYAINPLNINFFYLSMIGDHF